MPYRQSGFAHLVLILFLVIGLAIALVVIKDPTNLFPKAYDAPPATSERGEVVISGKAFVDINGDGEQEGIDWSLEGVKVYGPWVAGEPLRRSALTDSNGSWSMSVPDYYSSDCNGCNAVYISPNLPGLKATYGSKEIPLSGGRVGRLEGYDFTFRGTYQITGKIFDDINTNNTMDAGEVGLEGMTVVATLLFKTKTGTVTYYPIGISGPDGTYSISLPPLDRESVSVSAERICSGDLCWAPVKDSVSPGKINRDYVVDFGMFDYPNNLLNSTPYPYSSPDLNPSPNETPRPSSY